MKACQLTRNKFQKKGVYIGALWKHWTFFYHILVFGTLRDLPEKEKWLFLLYCLFVYELYYFLFTSFIKNPTRRVKAKIFLSWIISVFMRLIFLLHSILKLSNWNNKKATKKQTTTIFLRFHQFEESFALSVCDLLKQQFSTLGTRNPWSTGAGCRGYTLNQNLWEKI